MSEVNVSEVKCTCKNKLRNWEELQTRQVMHFLLTLAEAIEELQSKQKADKTPPAS